VYPRARAPQKSAKGMQGAAPAEQGPGGLLPTFSRIGQFVTHPASTGIVSPAMNTTRVVEYDTSSAGALPLARRRYWPRMQEAGLVLVILLIGTVLTLLAPTVRGENAFLRANNLIPSVLTTMSWIAIMAVGVTVVIISGGIDISVGSIMGLAALGAAAVLQQLPQDASAWIALPLGIGVPVAIGLLCGLLNGALVVLLRMHPFIVTLGTLSIFRGIALVSVREGSLPYGDRVLPDAFTDYFIAWQIDWNHAQPVPMLIMLIVMALAWVYLRWTVWGRQTYATGGNEEAARFSGIAVGWTKARTYLISGLCAGLAGMVSPNRASQAHRELG
jgi:ribose/xylose/arabinose/galactoside ABC-type transport system permease subunit